MTIIHWTYFVLIQLISFICTLIGYVVLLPMCLFRAWEKSPTPSINDGRTIDRWSLHFMNAIWGNPEDGVSGQTALVWEGATRVEYWLSCKYDWVRAYAWSAWRNSCNNLKYVFALANGPYWSGKVGYLQVGMGWKIENGKYWVPVFSVKFA